MKPSADKPKLILVGGGAHSHVVEEAARLSGWEVLGYIAPQKCAEAPTKYLGSDSEIRSFITEASFCVAVGSLSPKKNIREHLFTLLVEHGAKIATIRHPSAIISPSATIKSGAQVLAGTIIQPQAMIEENVIINTGAIVEHHTSVGRHSHIAPRATLCGNVDIGSNCHIGAGATVIQGSVLPQDSMIKANQCWISR